MLEYTWKPEHTLINSGSKITIRDLNQGVVTPPQAPKIENGMVTVYVLREGRYAVTVTTQNWSTTHHIDVNDPSNDVPSDSIVTPEDVVANLPDRLSEEALAATFSQYAPKDKLKASILSGSLRSNEPFPATMVSPPTMTFTTAGSTVNNGRQISLYSPEIFWSGTKAINWNSTFSRTSTPGLNAIEFILVGDRFEVDCFAAGVGGMSQWELFVDGKPATATPYTDSGVTLALGTQFWHTITFSSVARRHIKIVYNQVNSVKGIRTLIDALVVPAPPMLKAAYVGDSFFAGAASLQTHRTPPAVISRVLGLANFNISFGGTGYTLGNSGLGADAYGGPIRVADVVAADPDIIVISGSVNDDAAANTVQAAAAACFSAYHAALPGVPIIVFGAQPNNATATISAARSQNIAAVKAAALLAPNVIAFHDQVGTESGVPPTYSTGVTYSQGALVTYKGSVYKMVVPGTILGQTPGQSRWNLLTWGMTGTGKVGSVVGDGTRDIYLAADGIHPEIAGSDAFAVRMTETIRQDLMTFALTS